MQLQALAVATERVGQDDVGARIDELLVQGAHLVGFVEVPELGWIAGAEASLEVVGAGGAICQQRCDRSTTVPQVTLA